MATKQCAPDLQKFPVRIDPATCARHPTELKHELKPLWPGFQYCVVNLQHLLLFWGVCTVLAQGRWTVWGCALHLAMAYCYEQANFIAVHLMLQASFATRFGMYIKRPWKVNYGSYVAWFHHYVDVRKFTTNWLGYRNSYFDFPPYSMLMHIGTWWLAVELLALGECRRLFLLDLAHITLWRHLQALTHEYYHVRPRVRHTYFWLPPVNWLFRFFEWSGLICVTAHREHHAEDRKALTMADSFFDMWIPSCLEDMATDYWRARVLQYKPRELMGTADLCKDDEQEDNEHPFYKRIYRDTKRFLGIASVIYFLLCWWMSVRG